MRITPARERGGVDWVSGQKMWGSAPFLVLSETTAGAQDLMTRKAFKFRGRVGKQRQRFTLPGIPR